MLFRRSSRGAFAGDLVDEAARPRHVRSAPVRQRIHEGLLGDLALETTEPTVTRTLETRSRTRLHLFDRRLDRVMSPVDLGVEPPIEADGRKHDPDERRRVPWRWLCGTVLTGFTGACLIGSAIFTALGRQATFAEIPQFASTGRRDQATSELVNPRKADRLVKSVDIVAARQTFRAPTTISVGDKEVVRVRGFTRVATSLTTTSTGFADEVPPFDPLKLVSDSRNPLPDVPDAGPLQDDAEVSFSLKDLTGAETEVARVGLSIDEVQAQIAEHLKNALAAGSKAPLPLPSQILLMRTTRASLDPSGGLGYAPLNSGIIAAPFSSIEVRMVPENVTNIAKTMTSDDSKGRDQRLIVVRHNEGIEDILRAQGATRDQIGKIVGAINARRGQPPVTEGQRVKLLLAEGASPEQPQQIVRLSIYTDDKIESAVAMADDGSFVRVEGATPAPVAAGKKPAADDDDDDDTGGMRLYDSLYETALKNELPRPVIDDLVRVFANDVDFQRAVVAGDSLEAFYTEPDEADGRNELLFASITTRGETYKYYRFQTSDDGMVDYYDETGRSSRKFLVRQPIAAARITSGFGGRFHPILGYTRMHTGVDFGAPMGTLIFAAGNGTVIKAGRESGYGNRVEIQHANGYITTYNHMSGFARGISEGARVKQGQPVGYLGMTGLATGPHLHYEVIVNGHFVDPMRVKLARTRELDGRAIAAFKRERERIDGLIAKAPGATRVAASRTTPSN